jgi:FkbM family methyltransferase
MDCFGDEESQIQYEKAIRFRIKTLEFETLQPEDQPESFDTWTGIAASYHKTRNDHSEALPGFAKLGKVMPRASQFVRYFNPFGISPKIIHRASWIISSGIFDHLLDKEDVTERVILDCGAFEGESSAALHWMFQPSRIYAFEPLEEAFHKLDALARKMPAIHPVKMGTWISSKTATLDIAGEGSRVNGSSGNGQQSIVLTSIDDFVNNQALGRVDAIKMNIEGAEMPSLKGALSTIQRFQPSLSICAEHLPSDLWEIPTYLKQAHSNYVLSFKHCGPHIWASYVIGKAHA